jgi:uncharacterized protein YbcV (DUF1398 family)
MERSDTMKHAVEAALGRARSGGITYPQFVQLLIDAGLTSYHVDVATHAISFRRGADEIHAERGAPTAPPGATPAPFSKDGLVAAILENQQGKSTHPVFLQRIWAAGVTTYDVDLTGRTITYRGARGETHTERIAQPSN